MTLTETRITTSTIRHSGVRGIRELSRELALWLDEPDETVLAFSMENMYMQLLNPIGPAYTRRLFSGFLQEATACSGLHLSAESSAEYSRLSTAWETAANALGRGARTDRRACTGRVIKMIEKLAEEEAASAGRLEEALFQVQGREGA